MARTWSHKSTFHRVLKLDEPGNYQRGADVHALQAAVNRRLAARGQDAYIIKVDGEFGPTTAQSVSRAAYLLGITGSRFNRTKRKHGGIVDVRVQEVIRHPGSRTQAMLTRAQSRMSAERKRRDKAEAKARIASKGRSGALGYAHKYVGVKENPAGSNRGGIITTWQNALGAWLVGSAWCGTFAAACLRAAGVHGVTYRLASVSYIEDDARAHRGPFSGWTTDHRRVRQGDLVVLFGRGVHVAVVDRVTSTGVYTVEGNTSSGVAGSQSNGGMVAARFRPFSNVHGYALVNY